MDKLDWILMWGIVISFGMIIMIQASMISDLELKISNKNNTTQTKIKGMKDG